jgi:hypothetical protein
VAYVYVVPLIVLLEVLTGSVDTASDPKTTEFARAALLFVPIATALVALAIA